MRFKATITDGSSCASLHRTFHTIKAISGGARAVWLRLTPAGIHILLAPSVADAETRLFAKIKQEAVFTSYRLESRRENNHILLECSLEHLVRALKSALAASAVSIRLTKRDSVTYLALDITLVTWNGAERPVTQEIPVRVLPRRDMELARAPELPLPDVNVFLPDARTLRAIVDRVKTMSSYITLEATRRGDLTLKTESNAVSVSVYFRDLEVVSLDGGGGGGSGDGDAAGDDAPDPDEAVPARINIKKFAQFLSAHINPQNVLLSIARGRAAMLLVMEEDVSLTLSIPVVSD